MFCPRCHCELPAGYRFCPYDGAETVERLALEDIPSRPTRIGDTLFADRYRIEGFIGCGAVARVYLAHDELNDKPAAVKVLDPKQARDAEARKRFYREAEAVALIDHPNIAKIYQVGETDEGTPFLVLEFLFGESLGDYLRRTTTVAVNIGVPAMKQAASALWSAHEQGVIHRDLKPDNLFLVGEPGDPYELKVLDFGMSRLQTSQLTAAGMILGTPTTMAPEQVLGDPVDRRTDIYSLGMVMYRMFTGRYPFTAEDQADLIAHQVVSQAPPPSRFVKTIDPRLEALIRTMIRKRPASRYPDMAKLYEDLEKLSVPTAELWATSSEDAPYRPQTKLGELVADSLHRSLRARNLIRP